jgi:hypothetical protein
MGRVDAENLGIVAMQMLALAVWWIPVYETI